MRILAATLTLCFTIAAAEWAVVRKCDVLFDTKVMTIAEGSDTELECMHAPGKTHKLKVIVSKTYEFNGFGAHFEFDPSLNVTVDAKDLFATIRLLHGSGSNFTLQVFTDTKGGDVLEKFEAGLTTYLKASLGVKAIERSPDERIIAMEEYKGVVLTFTLGCIPGEVTCLWRPVGRRGRMMSFFKMGADRKSVDEAFWTIQKSIKFDPEKK